MTERFFMVVQTGSVYTLSELQEAATAEGEPLDLSPLTEVYPRVENPGDDPDSYDDWTTDPDQQWRPVD